MSMFDYDARPVTPGVVLVATTASRGGYAIINQVVAPGRVTAIIVNQRLGF